MLRRRGISVACTQTTRALLGGGASCHERLLRVTNGDRRGTSVNGSIIAADAGRRSGLQRWNALQRRNANL